jgi:hypothetical protein
MGKFKTRSIEDEQQMIAERNQKQIDLEHEYYERILVFKCRLNSEQEQGVWHIARYAFKCFKGTRKQFDDFCHQYIPNEIITPYLVYTNKLKIDNVTVMFSEFKDCRNFIGQDGNVLRYKRNKTSKRNDEYRYLKSSF